MARLFDDAASEYLSVSSPVVTNVPYSMSCWFYLDTLSVRQSLLEVTEIGQPNNRHRLRINTTGSCDLQIYYNGGSAVVLSTASNPTVNTWHNVTAVCAALNDWRIFLDGANKATSTTSVTDVNTWDETKIGGIKNFASGRIAESAFWSSTLTDAEVAILGAGYRPVFVRPESLVAYWPLIRDEDQDIVGGFDMTPINTPSIADHPPIIYSAPPYYTMPVSAAPAGITGPLIGGRLVKGGLLIKGRLVR